MKYLETGAIFALLGLMCALFWTGLNQLTDDTKPQHWPDPNPWQVVVDGRHVTVYTGEYQVYGPEQEPPMIPLRLNGEAFDIVGVKTYLSPNAVVPVPQHKYEKIEFDVPADGEYNLTGQRCTRRGSCERFTETFTVGSGGADR